MALVELQHVSKAFKDQPVLTDLSLAVPEGSIYGFVGENGAGKTTTMKLILGLLQRDAGTITVAGRPVVYGGAAVAAGIGYLPDVPEFYDELTPSEYLSLCGRLTGIDGRELPQRIAAMLKTVGLPQNRRRIRGFSRGMKQRLGVAQALLARPRLLIADEPTSALDPTGRREFLDLLASLRGETTILLSSHILGDVERICDHVGILHGGRLQAQGPLKALLAAHAQAKVALGFADAATTQQAAAVLHVAAAAKPVAAGAAPQPDATAVTATTLLLPAAQGLTQALQPALAALLAQGLVPVRVSPVQPSLEDLFMEVTR
ncbi:ABC transporter ATP-binding protein [Lacticaseibacillus parakribbianus]|uniref:ABC transporter ATP-binding protein n=1 Tax=Lacticaseibacillus parakribbianus TaxID=2970927 RepID=UPI0021CAE8F5|nr:ABC transporter ATP-binding protein [Lacticaseibacillus parakribbianus]